MTPAEVARLLAKAAAFDQRTIGAADVAAWHEVLSEVPVEDGMRAVTEHYSEQTSRLMPAHVLRLAAEYARARRRRAREAVEREMLQMLEADPTRWQRIPQVEALVAELRARLPASNPTHTRRPEWRADDRRRENPPEPNPHYDPDAAARAAQMVKEIDDGH